MLVIEESVGNGSDGEENVRKNGDENVRWCDCDDVHVPNGEAIATVEGIVNLELAVKKSQLQRSQN